MARDVNLNRHGHYYVEGDFVLELVKRRHFTTKNVTAREGPCRAGYVGEYMVHWKGTLLHYGHQSSILEWDGGNSPRLLHLLRRPCPKLDVFRRHSQGQMRRKRRCRQQVRMTNNIQDIALLRPSLRRQ